MIDAKDGFVKDGSKNRLREQDIQRIFDAWESQANIPHYSRLVPYSEIEKNEFNLNIPRYIQPKSTEIQQDLYAHLHGGLPAADVESMSNLWDVCPSLKERIFEPYKNKGYFQLTEAAQKNLSSLINDDESFKAQNAYVLEIFQSWKEYMSTEFAEVKQGCHPKEKITAWSKKLLELYKTCHSLIDSYAIYDELMKYWNDDCMQDDLYLISRDGWSVNVELPLAKSGKNKGNVKKTFDYTELHCDLVPVEILVNHFFKAEATEIEKTEQMIDAEQVAMETISEEFSDTFEEVPYEAVNGNFIKSVRSLIKEGKKQPKVYKDALLIWEDFDKHSKSQEKLKEKKKDLIKKLTTLVRDKYNSLNEHEIQELVFGNKWMDSLANLLHSLMNTTQNEIINSIYELNTRYETTLPEIENDLEVYSKLVKEHMRIMGFSL